MGVLVNSFSSSVQNKIAKHQVLKKIKGEDFSSIISQFQNASKSGFLNQEYLSYFDVFNGILSDSDSAMSSLSEKLIKLGEDGELSGEQIQDAFQQVVDEQFELSDQTSDLGTSFKNLGKAILGSLGNMAIMAAVSFLITSAIKIYDAWKNVHKEMLSSARELGEEFKDTETSINKYKKEIQDLQKTLGDNNTSQEDAVAARERLLAIQDELIDKYGDEAQAINNISSAITGEVDALDRLTEDKWQEIINEFNFPDDEEWEKSLAKSWWRKKYDASSNFDALKKVMEDQEVSFQGQFSKEILDYLSQLHNVEVETIQKTMGGEVIDINNVKIAGDNLQDIYQYLKNIQTLTDGMDDDFDRAIGERVKDVKETLDDGSGIYNQYVLHDYIMGTEYEKVWQNLRKEYDTYNKAVTSGNQDLADSEKKIIESIYTELYDGLGNSAKDFAVKDFFEKLYPQLTAEFKKHKIEIDFELGNGYKAEYQKEVLDAIDNFSSIDDVLNFDSEGATKEQQKSYNILKAAADEYGMEVDELIKRLKELFGLNINVHSEAQKTAIYDDAAKYIRDNRDFNSFGFGQALDQLEDADYNQIKTFTEKDWKSVEKHLSEINEEQGDNYSSASDWARAMHEVAEETRHVAVAQEEVNHAFSAQDFSENLTQKLGSIQSAYQQYSQDMQDEKHEIKAADIDAIEALRADLVKNEEDEHGNKNPFGVTEEQFNHFRDIVTNTTYTLEEQKEAWNELGTALATSYFEDPIKGIKDLDETTKQAIKDQLILKGYTKESVDAYVDAKTEQVEAIGKITDKLKTGGDVFEGTGIDPALLSQGYQDAAAAEQKYINGLDDIYKKYNGINNIERDIIHWDEEAFKKHEKFLIDEYESIEAAKEDLEGTWSTVLGSHENIEGFEIAYTQMLQTDHGLVPLTKDQFWTYFNQIFSQAYDGEKLDADKLIKLDSKGADVLIDGQMQHVSNMIAAAEGQHMGDMQITAADVIAISGDELAEGIESKFKGFSMHEVQAEALQSKEALAQYSEATLTAEERTKEFENAQKALSENGTTLEEATLRDIRALQGLEGISEQTIQSLEYYVAYKAAVSGTLINEDTNINELRMLGQAARLTAAELQVLDEIESKLAEADSYDLTNTRKADKIRSDAAAMIRNYQENIQERLNNMNLDFSPVVSDAKNAGSKAGDEFANAFQKKLEQMNSAISAVGTLMSSKITAANSAKDAAIKSLNEEKEAAIAAIKAEQKARVDAINAEIKAIDKQIKEYEKQQKVLQDQIKAIQDANAARERQLNLQKALYDLHRAEEQRTKLVYTGEVGQMRYERDEEAVRNAREEKKKAEDEIAIANIQKEIDLIQKSIDALNEHKEALQEELEAINEYYEELIADTEAMYDAMIKETEAYWDEIIQGLENIKSKWEELAEIDTIANAWGSLGKEMEELGFTVEDVLNDTPGAFEAFKQKYIETLAGANSENQHFLDGLNYATEGAAKAFGQISDNAGEIKKSLGEVAKATQPLEGAADNISSVGTTAGDAATNVGTLATKTGELADDAEKIAELAKAVDAVKTSIVNLSNEIGADSNPFSQLTNPLTTLLDLLKDISSILYGPPSEGFASIAQGLSNLATGVNLENLIMQFTALDGAINAVITSLNGGGKEQETESNQNGAKGANGTGADGNTHEMGGEDTLVSAIESVKTATDENIGVDAAAADDNAIGSFVKLQQAVDEVSSLIGSKDEETQGDAKEKTLIKCITDLKEVAENNIPPITELFTALETVVDNIAGSIASIVKDIQTLSTIGFGGIGSFVSGLFGFYAGTAHAEGTAKASGDWRVGRNEKSLVGELGQELVVRNGRYFTVGDRGPEFVDLKRDDIVFNHKQTAEILSKRNKIKSGPAFASGTLPNGFKPLGDDYAVLAAAIKRSDLPTMSGIVGALDSQTKDMGAIVQNIVRSASSATNVSMNNNFNISGVTGEDVARQISSHLQTTFLGLANNTMQYAKSR